MATKQKLNEYLPVAVAGLLVLVVVAALVVLLVRANSQDLSVSPQKQQPASEKPQVASNAAVTIAAMGDMIPHDTITMSAKTDAGYDYAQYFKNIRSIYASSDVVFCNQESTSAGDAFGISGYPTFGAPAELATGLQSAGCNVVSLANNHMADKGQGAIDATVAQWEQLKPLAYAGANRSADEQKKVRYFEKNGIKFAFLAFADFSNNKEVSSHGLNLYKDEELVKSLAQEARKNADVVLASMHWGDEDSHDVNADQQAQVAKLAEYGVDIVIGTGPHVLQKTEYVDRADGGKMLVWYSIGNMLSSQLELNQLTGGVAQMTVRKDGDKVVVEKPAFVPTFMSYEWTAEQQAAGDIAARKNPMIHPLASAADALKAMRITNTPAELKQTIQQILGTEVEVQ